ncbi:B12-binding domain-containing radical SAM protein [Desulfotomaculum copahuensis]|uniref:Uncharacterized protein n=1 Tax=Desulfotomaculum copahuensis TaxID=1838280 RepID=A0A1B7LCX3_9FIRM|nr:radical SAM protein [Desulfotomaculum copahuensis]OAT80739.1 hypothetical protein A6M21_12860 [Desulfotomaculum copahuensis]
MRILLLNPPLLTTPHTTDLVVNAPLSACLVTGYAGACLQQAGFEVQVADADVAGWTMAETAAFLSGAAYDLLGVHLKFLWERTPEILDLLAAVKRQKPAVHLNLYGHYPTFAWETLLREYPFIDSIARGEPEFILVELARQLAGPDRTAWRRIEGLARREGDKAVGNPLRPAIVDLDALPFPLRPPADLIARRQMHHYILGSRGCFGRCTFCYLNPFYGPEAPWRGRSPENIIKEINAVHRQTGSTSFYFADANFFGPGEKGRRRILELAALLKELDFPIVFGLECRSSDVEEEVFARLVEAGLRDVFLGVESGARSALDRFRKGTTVAQNERALKILRNLGIHISLGFINFDPGATLEEIKENLYFLQRMDLLDCPTTTAHLFFHRLVVLRGMPAYGQLLEQGRLHPAGFTGHEGEYQIADPRVEALARVMGAVARRTLEFTRGEDLWGAAGEKICSAGSMCVHGAGDGEAGLECSGTVSPPANGRWEAFNRLNMFLQSFLSGLIDEAAGGNPAREWIEQAVEKGLKGIEKVVRPS